MLAAGIVFVLAGVALRLYSAGILRKDRSLQRRGPYGFCRNPLYLGTIMLMLGFAFLAGSWALVILTLAVFTAVYLWVIILEERWLRAVFGEVYETYLKETPRLLPTPRSLLRLFEPVPFSLKQARVNHEHKTFVAGILGLGVFLLKYGLGLWLLPFHLW